MVVEDGISGVVKWWGIGILAVMWPIDNDVLGYLFLRWWLLLIEDLLIVVEETFGRWSIIYEPTGIDDVNVGLIRCLWAHSRRLRLSKLS